MTLLYCTLRPAHTHQWCGDWEGSLHTLHQCSYPPVSLLPSPSPNLPPPVQAAVLCSHHGIEGEGDTVIFRRGAFADVPTLPAQLEPHLVDAKHRGSYGEVGGAEGWGI